MPGDMMPSIRALARELEISVITTKRAYEELEKEQLIYSVAGKGFYVKARNRELLKEDQIRQIEEKMMEVSSRVSPIATLDFVREAMVAQQQEMGKAKGIVMDGRDIGTTVFPDAELKIFVTATPEIRAQRRYDELKAKGEEASFDEILENVKQRDYIDQNRDVSPLRKASDALLLDNSHLSISQQKEWLAEQFERVIKEKN